MRGTLLLFTLLSTATSFAGTAEDQIRGMAGCYEVTYEFVETFVRVPQYPITSKPYRTRGVEWVSLDKDVAGEIHLQHILTTTDGAIKHWRQEWIKEAKTMWSFQGGNKWAKADVTPEAGQWLQRVTQVDDSPRYECQAHWVHTGQKDLWECESPAPLPRREATYRSDYDVLQRTTQMYLTPKGWEHEQDNQKVQSSTKTVVAEEKGFERYRKLPASECELAIDWWNENKAVWSFIQEEWHGLYQTRSEMNFKADIDGTPLWAALWAWADEHRNAASSPALRAEVQAIIASYLN